LRLPQTIEKGKSTASNRKNNKKLTNKNYIFTFHNRAASIEETALLLAFDEHKLYRTIVRRRICVRQIYLPFSMSTQRVEVSRHAEATAHLRLPAIFYILKTRSIFMISFLKDFSIFNPSKIS